VQREVRRGNKYRAIILDPPAYGRGPEGEKWVLESSINELMHLCNKLLHTEHAFLVLNLYSMGFSPLVAESLVKSTFQDIKNISTGELFVTDKARRKLPLGMYCRMER
jgi:23S rRNA (cytosine1962-C5)-methyltransferase